VTTHGTTLGVGHGPVRLFFAARLARQRLEAHLDRLQRLALGHQESLLPNRVTDRAEPQPVSAWIQNDRTAIEISLSVVIEGKAYGHVYFRSDTHDNRRRRGLNPIQEAQTLRVHDGGASRTSAIPELVRSIQHSSARHEPLSAFIGGRAGGWIRRRSTRH
jgi:hypothetical protein